MPRTFIDPEDRRRMMERAVRAFADTEISFDALCRRYVPFIQRKALEARLRAEGLYPRTEAITTSDLRRRCRTPERWVQTGHERKPRTTDEFDLRILRALADGVNSPTALGTRLTDKFGKDRARWASKQLSRLMAKGLVQRVDYGKYEVTARGRQLLEK